jgi:hypothetical protein
MTHAIRIKTATSQASNPGNVPSPGPPEFVDSLIEDRIQQNLLGPHSEVLSGQAQDATEVNGPETTAHYRALRHLDSAEDKTTVLDAAEDSVAADAEWYQIEYHQCDHDLDTGVGQSGCPDWTVERSNGSVPSDV